MKTNHTYKAARLSVLAAAHSKLAKAEDDVEELKRKLQEAQKEVDRLKKQIEEQEGDTEEEPEEVSARLSSRRVYARYNAARASKS